MRVLSLFSGGGLGDYGLTLAGMEIVGQVEIDDYCQKILKLRWPDVPKWRDIRDVKGSEVLEKCGRIDLISGGFPCQDISPAGTRSGIEGERSGLWKEMFRVICEVRPKFCLVENSSALLGRGISVVLSDLASIGYDSEWDCIPASALGAPHQRDRVWIMAYPKMFLCGEKEKDRYVLGEQTVQEPMLARNSWWRTEPSVGRMAHGIAGQVERLKLLGNGQVVQVVEWIGKRIMEYEAGVEN